MKAIGSDSVPRISAAILAQMSRYLSSRGADLCAMPSAAALDPAAIKDLDARIPLDLYLRIEDDAAKASGDELFGLHMGEFAVTGSWSVLGLLMMNCVDLAEAFAKSALYCKIIGDLVRGRSSMRGDRITIDLESSSAAAPASRHCYECTLSSLVSIMRDLTGRDVSPLEVGIPGPETASASEYRRIFRCPIVFGSPAYRLVVSKSIGAIPLLFSNARLLARIEAYAQELLRDIEDTDPTSRAAAALIVARLADGKLSIEGIARDMAMSVRTLQSRLEGEGRRFQDLVAETRLGLAKRYLRERLSVEEITCLLGFSDPSIFRKAFKKWSGMTPGEFLGAEAASARRPGAAPEAEGAPQGRTRLPG